MWQEEQLDVAIESGIVESRFWTMTPAHVAERYAVYVKRQQREWERAAWMVHHIMSAFVGSDKAPSVDKLLGRSVKEKVM